jgi:hypothetical protein
MREYVANTTNSTGRLCVGISGLAADRFNDSICSATLYLVVMICIVNLTPSLPALGSSFTPFMNLPAFWVILLLL